MTLELELVMVVTDLERSNLRPTTLPPAPPPSGYIYSVPALVTNSTLFTLLTTHEASGGSLKGSENPSSVRGGDKGVAETEEINIFLPLQGITSPSGI